MLEGVTAYNKYIDEEKPFEWDRAPNWYTTTFAPRTAIRLMCMSSTRRIANAIQASSAQKLMRAIAVRSRRVASPGRARTRR